MLDRLARLTSVHDHLNPGNPVTTTLAAHPWTPRWVVLWVAKAWFTVEPGQPLVVVKRVTLGRPVAVWDVTWFQPPHPALDQPQEPTP